MSTNKRNNTNGGGSPALQRVRECGTGKPGHARPENAPTAGDSDSRRSGVITENVSAGVGRPRAFALPEIEAVRRAYPHITSERGLVQRAYAYRASLVLGQMPGARWKWIGLNTCEERACVLSELGRIRDESRIVAFAVKLEREPPASTREAIQLIRQARRAKGLTESAYDLSRMLRETVKRFRTENPESTWRDVVVAFQIGFARLPRQAKKDQVYGVEVDIENCEVVRRRRRT